MRPGPNATATPEVPHNTNATMLSDIASQWMSIQRDGAVVATNATAKVNASATAKALAGSAAATIEEPPGDDEDSDRDSRRQRFVSDGERDAGQNAGKAPDVGSLRMRPDQQYARDNRRDHRVVMVDAADDELVDGKGAHHGKQQRDAAGAFPGNRRG